MGLNDEEEKLRQAEEWLLHDVPGVMRMHRNAAWEYVLYVYSHAPDSELRGKAREIINKYREHPS